MNPNLSSNMMNVSTHMKTGAQQTTSTSSAFMTSQPMSTNMMPSLSMSINSLNPSHMDSSPLISSTTNPMASQSGQQPQQVLQQSMQQTMNPKDVNTAYLCRIGHETVQEIVNKSAELFQLLRMMSPPNGSQPSIAAQEEKKGKTKDLLKTIELLFKRLRKFYERCNECCAPIDYIQIESLIPMKDTEFGRVDDKKSNNNNKVKHLDKEHEELVQLLELKNRQIKEVIDNLRSIVWEINTMLAMRKP